MNLLNHWKQVFETNPIIRRGIVYHRDKNCCCGFLDTKSGVNVLTIGLVLAVVIEFTSFNLTRAVLKIAIMGAFLLMWVSDDAQSRALAFITYFLGTPSIAVINVLMYRNLLLDSVVFAKELCWSLRSVLLTESNECNTVGKSDYEQCEDNVCPILPSGIMKVALVIGPLAVTMYIHFCLVLYTHWKNNGLPKDQGGCQWIKIRYLLKKEQKEH